MYALAERLWPLCRSISGDGLRATLAELGRYLPGLRTYEVPSGRQVLDWIVPEEWRIRSARLIAPDGRCIANFEQNNLHVVGYSTGVDAELELDELQPHLHSLPDMPDAIPYITSYYHRSWGFCIPHSVRAALAPGRYRAQIDAEHFPGSITLGEWRLPGAVEQEVLLSTYCCHPSMANNELSGPCLAAQLGRWLASAQRRLSYRILFVPEMIGSIAYLAEHLDELKARVIAGYVLTCVGDERGWSFLPSRAGNTLADRVGRHVLRHHAGAFREHNWNERGSDESNYCAPGVDLPVASIMRSKYGCYPEYHSSLDRLGSVVTAQGLAQSLLAYQRVIEALEAGGRPRTRVLGEPQLGPRGLYPPLGTRDRSRQVRLMLDVLSHSDGSTSPIEVAERCGCAVWEVLPVLQRLRSEGLVDWPGSALANPLSG